MTKLNRTIIRLLATAGLSAKGISKFVRKANGLSYSIGYVYAMMSDMGVSAKKYRNGETEAARALVRQSLQQAADKALPARSRVYHPTNPKPLRMTA